MLYPVYVHIGDETHAHSVTFPDFPGCFSAADEWENLPAAIQEAVEAHFAGEPDSIPEPTPLEKLAANPEYRDGVWMLADLDLSRINAKAVALNISLPEHVVQRIDAYANLHRMSRSAFIALAISREMQASR